MRPSNGSGYETGAEDIAPMLFVTPYGWSAGEPMPQADERVVLGRAVRGLDLWSLIESAQYARVVFHEQPADQTEAEAITSFTEALSAIIEAWDELALRNAAPMLKDLDDRLDDLARRGLFVHGSSVERSVRTPSTPATALPVAIIRIGHDGSDRVGVAIPAELLIDLTAEEPSAR